MESKALILAAGKGTRLRSKLAKPLHKIAGLPLISWVMIAKQAAITDMSIIISPDQTDAFKIFENNANLVSSISRRAPGMQCSGTSRT